MTCTCTLGSILTIGMGNATSIETNCKRLKIVLLGDLGVGKSSLAHTFQTGKYNENFKPSSGTLFYMKILEIRGEKVELHISEPVNHKKFPYVWPTYVKQSDGVLLLYDVSDLKTLKSLSSLLRILRKHNSTAVIFLVGTKSDYEEDMNLSHDTAEAFANRENLEFFECSAKKDENVQYIFETLALRILQIKNLTFTNEIGVDAMVFEESKILEGKKPKYGNDGSKLSIESKHAGSDKEYLIVRIENELSIPEEKEGKCKFRAKNNSRDKYVISSKKYSESETQKCFPETSKGTYSQDRGHGAMSDVETSMLSKEEILVEGKCTT